MACTSRRASPPWASFLVILNKEGFELSLGPAVPEEMEPNLKGVGGGDTESYSVILPRTRP